MNKRIVLFLAVTVFVATCPAQRDRATLTGIVTDSSGAVVPSVPLTITNTDTGIVYRADTTEAGAYTVPNLPVGAYKVQFEAPGFKKVERLNIQLTPGQVLRVDARLEVGAVSESVEVTAELSRVETETARVAIDMANNQVNNLPTSITNRSLEDWTLKILPGVSGSVNDNTVNGVTVHNAKASLLDGTPMGSSEQGTITEASPSIEAVGEFNILTAGYSAEYGRVANGVYNYVLKSGTNSVHGGGFAGLRNEALNANTFVNNFSGRPRAFDRKQNYSFGLGGPVYLPKIFNGKDKTFFYASFEHYRQHQYGMAAANAAYPLPEFYQGDFSRLLTTTVRGTDALGRSILQGVIYDPNSIQLLPSGRYIAEPFTGNKIPVNRFSKVSQNINQIGIAHYLPTFKDPNTGLYPLTLNAANPGSGNISLFDQYNFAIKLDHNISDRHKLSGSFDNITRLRDQPAIAGSVGMWDWSEPDGGPFANFGHQNIHTNRGHITEDWTITPTMFNHFSVNYNRQGNLVIDSNVGTDGAAVYGIKGLKLTDNPIINWGGGPVYSLSGPSAFNLNNMISPWGSSYVTWAFQDSLGFSKGRHFMKVGYENWNWAVWGPVGPPLSSFTFSSAATTIPQEQVIGSYTGYSFASYLLGIVNNAVLAVPAPRTLHGLYHAAYFQDDFKARPNLTLNIGLRYDYNPLSYEAYDRVGSWDPAVTDPLVNLPGAYKFAGNCSGCMGVRNFGKRDFNNFAPRVGFAWQVVKNFTVRGSYTVTYIGDDSGTALGDLNRSDGGIGPDIVGNGTNNLQADPVYPWRGIFNWDNGMPTNMFVPPSRNLSYADAVGNAYMIDPRYGITPYVQQWNLNLQKQLPGRLLVDVGYIGNKSTKLRDSRLVRLNQTPPSVITQYGSNLPRTVTSAADAARYGVPYPYAGFSGTVNSALRQFPQLRANDTVVNIGGIDGFGTYHSLNVIVNRQMFQGLSVYGNWVWSKTINNMGNGVMDYYNRAIEKAIASNDVPHFVKIFAEYRLPFGRGRAIGGNMPRVLDAVLGGWYVSGIGNYGSGRPIGFSGASSINGWNGGSNRVNVAPGALRLPDGVNKKSFDYANRLSNPAANKYFDTSLVTNPAALTFGTAAPRYGQLRTWGTINEDMALRKEFRLTEKYVFRLRGDFLNALNRSTLPSPVTSTTSPNFGYMTGNPSGNRTVQVGLRCDF
jgi:hypothetical protein